MSTSNEFVLPATVRPARYAISLEPDLERFTFDGEETVAIDVAESVSEIVLNAIELEVHSAALNRDGAAVSTKDIRLDAARETVTLDFGETVAPGHYGPGLDLHRRPERQAPRLLPQPVHRPRRRNEIYGRHPVRGHRRPSRFSLLGRAGVQGDVPSHPRHTRRPESHIQYPGGGGVPAAARCCRGSALPKRRLCQPTSWPSWWATSLQFRPNTKAPEGRRK